MAVKLYRWGFCEAFASVTELQYDHLSWSNKHIRGLADAIAYCYDVSRFDAARDEDLKVESLKAAMLQGVETIDLSHNLIETEGVLALVRALSTPGALPNLRTICLQVNQISNQGCLALVGLLRDESKLPKLEEVLMGGNPDISDDTLDELEQVLEARSVNLQGAAACAIL